ncbi:MAG: leucyl aminopeptidase [Nanoarchaeota archaeon]
MDVKLTTQPLLKSTDDAVAIFFLKDHIKTNNVAQKFPPELKTLLQAVIGECEFTAEPDQCIPVHTKTNPRLILLIGCGEKAKFNLERMRLALSTAMKAANNLNVKNLAVSITAPDLQAQEVVTSLAETAHLCTYRFDKYKSEKKPFKLQSLVLADAPENEFKQLTEALNIGNVLGSLARETRELVNTPPDICTPDYFAELSKKLGKEYGFKVTIYDKKELEKMDMQGILHVGAGGSNPPCMVVAEYKNGKGKKTAFVGKGVCFDSGGLDIKPANGMDTMKLDKAGACTVIHTIAGCAKLGLKGHFIGIMPMVENMPGSSAYKPGEIIVTRSKKTIEILNTDAEGRVILSDALFYASEQKPDYIVDVATLTGACVVALGNSVAGLMGNNQEIISKIKNAAAKRYERVWELPMDDDYYEMIKSEFGDVKNVVSNTPGGGAGTITAAKFLEVFVGGTPWAHLDIAGPAWAVQEKGYFSSGATGFGLRLLLQTAIDLSD